MALAMAAACLCSVRDGRGPDTGKPRTNVGAFLCLVYPDGGSRLMWSALYASIDVVAGERGIEECDAVFWIMPGNTVRLELSLPCLLSFSAID